MVEQETIRSSVRVWARGDDPAENPPPHGSSAGSHPESPSVVIRQAAEHLVAQLHTVRDTSDRRLGVPEPGAPAEREYWPGEDPVNSVIHYCRVPSTATGVLDGVDVGLKDSIAVAGIPLTLGVRAFAELVPSVDATVATRILAHGGTITAKLNLDGLSHGDAGFGSGGGDYGRCLNPRNMEYLSGGSSSGSAAAVAAGIVEASLGGDQGGSIRVPASWCGLVGLKPTFGLVPHTGCIGVESSIDHVGPLAHSARMVAQLLDVIAGPDGQDPRQVDVPGELPRASAALEDARWKGVRLGVLQEGFSRPFSEPTVDQSVYAAVTAMEERGATVVPVSFPEHVEVCALMPAVIAVGDQLLRSGAGALFQAPGDADLYATYSRRAEESLDSLPPRVQLNMSVAEHLTEELYACYARAARLRRYYLQRYDALLRDFDCLVMPTTPIRAPRYHEPPDTVDVVRRSLARSHSGTATANCGPFNLTGHPAVSVPCAADSPLPVGIQFVGKKFTEPRLLQIAHLYESLALRSKGSRA